MTVGIIEKKQQMKLIIISILSVHVITFPGKNPVIFIHVEELNNIRIFYSKVFLEVMI